METPPPNTNARNTQNLPSSNARTDTTSMMMMETEETGYKQREVYHKLKPSNYFQIIPPFLKSLHFISPQNNLSLE